MSGHVERPGLYELPLGTRLDEIVFEHAGGVPEGRKVKGVIPGGMSMPILPAGQLDVPMANEFLRERQTMLGTGGIMVMDETTCMVRVELRHHVLLPRRVLRAVHPVPRGHGLAQQDREPHRARRRHRRGPRHPGRRRRQDGGQTICAFADAAAWPVQGLIRHFRERLREHVRQKKCPFPESFEL